MPDRWESTQVSVPQPWRAAGSLAWREILRFFRQRNRVIGAVGQPILFWLLFGAGLNRSFRVAPDIENGPSFLEYYFPGTLVLILLFTAIFATISIIEDRKEGFLQAVLVAPIPRWSMVLGKVLGGTTVAMLQGCLFLLLAWTLPIPLTVAKIGLLVVLLFLAAMALTGLGFVLAWRMESTQGFHAIMNLLLMPMWLLSGAFFPVPTTQPGATIGELALHWCMRINPVTYCVAGVRWLISDPAALEGLWMPTPVMCWVVTFVFAGVMFLSASRIAGQRIGGDLL
jgi:ABC-2 type transport system permease protein